MIKGRIFSGLGEGAFFTNLDCVREQCQLKLKFVPFPGTLNLYVNKIDLKTLRKIKAGQGVPLVSPNTQFCPAKCIPIRIGTFEGAIVMPQAERHTTNIHPEEVVEIISPVNLKEALALKDGDEIQVEILNNKADELQPDNNQNADLKARTMEYINSHGTMTLATSANNIPWAASVYYANDGITFYFISNPDTCLHCRNIAINPAVALTINEDYPLKKIYDWKKIKGIQIEGTAQLLLDKDELNKAIQVYAAKYPFTAVYLKSMATSEKILSFLNKLTHQFRITPDFTASMHNNFYKVDAKRVWMVDNKKKKKKRQEVFF